MTYFDQHSCVLLKSIKTLMSNKIESFLSMTHHPTHSSMWICSHLAKNITLSLDYSIVTNTPAYYKSVRYHFSNKREREFTKLGQILQHRYTPTVLANSRLGQKYPTLFNTQP